MNILVCIKHVPKEEDMKLDPVTKTLIRGGEGEISAMDKFALELATRVKEENGGLVVAVSMGLPAANASLRYALSVGADEAYLISDRTLAGSDAYATAAALSAAVKKLERDRGKLFDLILCGKQASDSDTSLVTPALAELLGRPHATAILDYADSTDSSVTVTRELDEGTEDLRIQYPAVLSVGKTTFSARYPNLRLKLAANRREIPVLTAEALSIAPEKTGTQGSLTDVGSSFIPEHSRTGIRINGTDANAAARQTAAALQDRGLL